MVTNTSQTSASFKYYITYLTMNSEIGVIGFNEQTATSKDSAHILRATTQLYMGRLDNIQLLANTQVIDTFVLVNLLSRAGEFVSLKLPRYYGGTIFTTAEIIHKQECGPAFYASNLPSNEGMAWLTLNNTRKNGADVYFYYFEDSENKTKVIHVPFKFDYYGLMPLISNKDKVLVTTRYGFIVVDPTKNEELSLIETPTSPLIALCPVTNTTFMTLDQDKLLKFWDYEYGENFNTLELINNFILQSNLPIVKLMISSDLNIIYVITVNGVYIVDSKAGVSTLLPGYSRSYINNPRQSKLTPDGKYLVLVQNYNKFNIIDIEKQKNLIMSDLYDAYINNFTITMAE